MSEPERTPEEVEELRAKLRIFQSDVNDRYPEGTRVSGIAFLNPAQADIQIPYLLLVQIRPARS